MGPAASRSSRAPDAPRASLRVAGSGRILDVGEDAARLLRAEPDELVGRHLQDLVAEPPEKVVSLLPRDAAGPQVIWSSLVLVPEDGPWVKCLVRVTARAADSSDGDDSCEVEIRRLGDSSRHVDRASHTALK